MANREKGASTLDDLVEVDKKARKLICKPFDFESPVPPRKLIEINGCKSYAQGFLSVTGASGGTGKSSLAIVEELSLALGYDLFKSNRPSLRCGRKRVWSMSLEDDEAEHRRRVIAAIRHYGVKADDLVGHYMVTYKADSPVEVGFIDKTKGFVVSPQVEEIKDSIVRYGIEIINVDPFVSTHGVSENDNGAMNKVADVWRSIAQECNVALGLTHHIRKSGAGHEIGAEDLRGAVSLTSAARLVRVLAPMSQDEAKAFGVPEDQRRFHFWVNPSAKANITPPATSRIWYHMASVSLDNGIDTWDGDNIGVVEAWETPDRLEGVSHRHVDELARRLLGATDTFLLEHCRKDVQSDGWIGYLIAEILGSDIKNDLEKNRIKRIIKEWLHVKVIAETKLKDEKRRDRACFCLGNSAQTVVIDS